VFFIAKIQTTVLLDEELRNLAKARRVSISKVCNSALSAVLAVPNTKQEIDTHRQRLKQELDALNKKEAELTALNQLQEKRDTSKAFFEDVKGLQAGWAAQLRGERFDWADLVSQFCKKWRVDRAVAIAYADGSKQVMEVR